MSKLCLNKALRTLTRRDHSCAELRKKLEAFGCTNREIQDAVEQCMRLGYLNDERFANGYVRQLLRKGSGIYKIEKELYAKGVPKEIINNCVASSCSEGVQLETCRRALAKKTKYVKDREKLKEMRAKLQRFLSGRGFSKRIIYQALAETMDEKE